MCWNQVSVCSEFSSCWKKVWIQYFGSVCSRQHSCSVAIKPHIQTKKRWADSSLAWSSVSSLVILLGSSRLSSGRSRRYRRRKWIRGPLTNLYKSLVFLLLLQSPRTSRRQQGCVWNAPLCGCHGPSSLAVPALMWPEQHLASCSLLWRGLLFHRLPLTDSNLDLFAELSINYLGIGEPAELRTLGEINK